MTIGNTVVSFIFVEMICIDCFDNCE